MVLVIIPYGLLQVPSLKNDNLLLKMFFQRSSIWLYTIIVSLYHCYVVTFCIWSLYFVYRKNNQPTKQTRWYCKQERRMVVRFLIYKGKESVCRNAGESKCEIKVRLSLRTFRKKLPTIESCYSRGQTFYVIRVIMWKLFTALKKWESKRCCFTVR